MRGISTERHTLCPSEVRDLEKTSDDVDNFVDKGVDNKGITVENMCKGG